jgi:hypothetical protein
VLDLDHRALAGAVRLVQSLGHDPVEPGALEAPEPVLGQRAISRRRRDVHRRRRVGQRLFQPLASRRERRLAQILVAQREQVPGHERRGRLRGQELHARSGGMNAQEQRLEVEPAGAHDDDLAVDDAALGQRAGQRFHELGEVPVHRLLVAALQQDLVAVAEHEGAKPVPLGLEQPALTGGKPVGGAGQHRLDRRVERQAHGLGPTRD